MVLEKKRSRFSSVVIAGRALYIDTAVYRVAPQLQPARIEAIDPLQRTLVWTTHGALLKRERTHTPASVRRPLICPPLEPSRQFLSERSERRRQRLCCRTAVRGPSWKAPGCRDAHCPSARLPACSPARLARRSADRRMRHPAPKDNFNTGEKETEQKHTTCG